MILKHGIHLAYCTNVHPGEDWAETFDSLNRYTMRVKEQVQPKDRYAIGLRLSDQASRELSEPTKLLEFQRWLDLNDCYVFTINGFPFGQFHGTRVKERVYLPDWSDPQRLEYTTRLFDLLAQLLPPGVDGSVSTLPGSFKDFITTPKQQRAIRDNVWRCVGHMAKTCERTGLRLHLGLEPEPFGLFENSEETVTFFDRLRDEHPRDARLNEHLGVNYDACHFAIEFEEPSAAIARFQRHGIRLSKIHLSNALNLRPSPAALQQLAAFADNVYLHQVIVRRADGSLAKFRDLAPALSNPLGQAPAPGDEWRVHFHVPLCWQPSEELGSTADHLLGLLKTLQGQPELCSHLEMETYTWAVLPEGFRSRNVTDQIVAEYNWTRQHLAARGLI
jgi:hypothetical protein